VLAEDARHRKEPIAAIDAIAEVAFEGNEAARWCAVLLEPGGPYLGFFRRGSRSHSEVCQHVLDASDADFDAPFVQPHRAPEFGVDHRHALVGRGTGELAVRPLLVEHVSTVKGPREVETLPVEAVAGPTAHAGLVEHPARRTLVQIEAVVRPGRRLEGRRRDPFAGGAVLVARIRPIELRVVDRVAVFGHLKAVVVDDSGHEDRPREVRRIDSGNDPPEDPDAVEFVAIGGRLHVERRALPLSVDDCYR